MDYSSLGLVIIPDFLSQEEESQILLAMGHKQTSTRRHMNGKMRNAIRRYGSDLPYKSHMISRMIPEFLDSISEKIYSQKLLSNKPDSITINQYLKGQCIIHHIDSKSSGPVITILSLLGSAEMEFVKGNESFQIDYPPRCLVQLKDEIRYDWTHAVPPVKEDRYSIVFRHAHN